MKNTRKDARSRVSTKDDLVLKQIFGKRKTPPKSFFGKIGYGIQKCLGKTWGFVKQLKPIHSIAIVIVAVFILQAIIPQSVLWPWFKTRAGELTGNWRQVDWSGGKGQATVAENTDKYATDDGRISVLESFTGKAGFVSYANRSYVAVDNDAGKPAVAMDQSGRTLTVWVDERGGNNKPHLYARVVDSKGRALPLQGGSQDKQVDDVNYDEVDDASFDQPAVVYDPISGHFVVVWTHTLPGEGNALIYNVYMQTLKWTNSGLSPGNITSVAGDDAIAQRNPHLAVRYRFAQNVSENEIIVTWQEEYNNSAYFRVKAIGYKINTSGTLTPASIGAKQISKTFTSKQVNDYVGLGYSGCEGPMVAITVNGKAMIVWAADYDDGNQPEGDRDVRGRVYSTSEFWNIVE